MKKRTNSTSTQKTVWNKDCVKTVMWREEFPRCQAGIVAGDPIRHSWSVLQDRVALDKDLDFEEPRDLLIVIHGELPGMGLPPDWARLGGQKRH